MSSGIDVKNLAGLTVHCVGIKGTGMAALAELFHKLGARISGSDTTEEFYTDAVLKELGIPYAEGFSPSNLPRDAGLVIHSAAYDRESNPELAEADRLGIPVYSYPEALGLVSGKRFSVGIAGTHGKTTTAAMTAAMLMHTDIPVSVLVGSAVSNLGGRSVLVQGDRYFIAETCEYRRHFLHFRPSVLVITNIEADHLDYYSGYGDVLDAFVQYGMNLSEGGCLIYCADDPGAREAAERITYKRPDIEPVPYGRTAEGPFSIFNLNIEPGTTGFALKGFSKPCVLHIPGEHTVLNGAAAAAVVSAVHAREKGGAEGSCAAGAGRLTGAGGWIEPEVEDAILRGLDNFRGSSRRSEILGEAGDILFVDDYGHHPTEIAATIAGLRQYYPTRRLVVDFMSHTFTRTKAFFRDFTSAFRDADLTVFHKIYSSARENVDGTVTGKDLFREAEHYTKKAVYFHEIFDALDYLKKELKPGDLFITMGAGSNWALGRELFRFFTAEEKHGNEEHDRVRIQ